MTTHGRTTSAKITSPLMEGSVIVNMATFKETAKDLRKEIDDRHEMIVKLNEFLKGRNVKDSMACHYAATMIDQLEFEIDTLKEQYDTFDSLAQYYNK